MNILEFIETYPALWAGVIATFVLWLVVERALFLRKGKAVSNTELVRLLNQENALVLDLRPDKEFAEKHIKDSIQCDIKQTDNILMTVEKNSGRPIVFVCGYGAKSGHAGQILNEKGVENVFRLRGGLMGWEGEHLPLVRQ